MSIYSYRKRSSSEIFVFTRFFSYVLITLGFGFLMWAVYPIFAYELQYRITDNIRVLKPSLTGAGENGEETSIARVNNELLSQGVRGFLDLSEWFPMRPQQKGEVGRVNPQYFLTIPKLSIKDAKVSSVSEDLSQSLVQYLPKTAPGEYGSVNIFGHSTLPQLYKNNDYKSIFTHLPDLEKGDSITVTYDNTQHEFEVYDMFVVKPEQVSVLEPRYDGSYLTLITCVPPGTYWNRLVVRAKLKHLPFKAS